eukprot:1156484-Pelagomonas_calceolata.AAC.13
MAGCVMGPDTPPMPMGADMPPAMPPMPPAMPALPMPPMPAAPIMPAPWLPIMPGPMPMEVIPPMPAQHACVSGGLHGSKAADASEECWQVSALEGAHEHLLPAAQHASSACAQAESGC